MNHPGISLMTQLIKLEEIESALKKQDSKDLLKFETKRTEIEKDLITTLGLVYKIKRNNPHLNSYPLYKNTLQFLHSETQKNIEKYKLSLLITTNYLNQNKLLMQSTWAQIEESYHNEKLGNHN